MSPRCSTLLVLLLAAGCPLNEQSLPAFGERCQNSGDCNRDFACFIADEDSGEGICVDPSSIELDCRDGEDDDGDDDADCDDADCNLDVACDDDCSADTAVLGDNVGDTSNRPPDGGDDELSCLDLTSGVQAWRFTGSANGTIRIAVDPTDADDDLDVLIRHDDCKNIEDAVCQNSAGPGAIDDVDVDVADGETIFILVGGFEADDEGPYSLTLTVR